MPRRRVNLELIPRDEPADEGASRAGEDARRWLLQVDGAPAGAIQAVARGAEVELDVVVAEDARRRGIARAAIGRLLGAGPWGTGIRYVARIRTDDVAAAALARSLGFIRDAPEGDPVRWSRPAPRPRAAADDITRFLDADGRIDRYPVRDAERRELLSWVAERALPQGEVLTEAAVNERLAPYAPGGDVAVLRRYLVDHELVERTRSGSEYLRL